MISTIDLVNQYESLRRLALGETCKTAVHRNGLFLLIHKGMACWIESWLNRKVDMGIGQGNLTERGGQETKTQQPKLEFVTMLADIILANRREVK